jgi:Rhodopirellula transposase DDE domain/Helix-turn-helix of DDE superfamily endonuclease
MAVDEDVVAVLASKFQAIFPHLDERQRRLLAGAEACSLGHGGIRAVARAAGMREGTVSDGVTELESGADPLNRVRRAGGGRKSAAEVDPGLVPALMALVEPDMRGDPMSPLRWTTKSTRNLAGELSRAGHRISADTVGDLLRAEGFSLQGSAKVLEGKQHPDRDGQFRYINEQVKEHQGAGEPVVSVDAKKKELVGQFKNTGRQWQPAGQPVKVDTHDFLDRELGKAIPYGVYDLTANTGWVNVGTDHDTAAFAVASIRRWWASVGAQDYPNATRLLITADAGGSNGYRTRAWKTELAALAEQTGLHVTVCHLPPGTSKWNKIEHRLFSAITMNWRGRPLTSHEVIVNSIASTTTGTGLTVRAELDPGSYPTGVEISDAQLEAVPLTRHRFHGDWNYTIGPVPMPSPDAAAAEPCPLTGHGVDRVLLSHPDLTGMSRERLDQLVEALAEAHDAGREQARGQRRGAERRRSRGAGPKPKLDAADQILAAVLYLRKLCTQAVLGELFAVDKGTIGRAVQEISPLLDQHGYTVTPSTARFPSPADLAAYLAMGGPEPKVEIKPAC